MPLFGKIENLLSHLDPGSRLHQGLCYLRDYQRGHLPDISSILIRQNVGDVDKIPIHGDALYILVQTYRARSREQGRFEAHRYHTDLQYLCEGQEWVSFCDLHLQPDPPVYDSNNNLYFPLDSLWSRSHSRLLHSAGNVAVFFPSEAHAPCLRIEGIEDGVLRKVVVKIKDVHLAKIPPPISIVQPAESAPSSSLQSRVQ